MAVVIKLKKESEIMPREVLQYRLKKSFTKNKCRILKCSRKPRARGICEKHAQYLAPEGMYEKFAAPERMLNKYRLKPKKNQKKPFCIMLDCKKTRRCRGICSVHSGQLTRRGIYDDFALPKK